MRTCGAVAVRRRLRASRLRRCGVSGARMMAASDADALRQLMRLGTAPQRQDHATRNSPTTAPRR